MDLERGVQIRGEGGGSKSTVAQELSQLHAHMQGIYCSKFKIIAEPLFTLITTIIIVILEDITIPLQQLRNILQLQSNLP